MTSLTTTTLSPRAGLLRPSHWAAVLTAATWLVVQFQAPPVLRAPVVLGFGLLAPGLALVSLMGLRRPLLEVMLAIGTSVAILILVSYLMVTLGSWSSTTGLASLSLPVLACVPIELVRHRRAGDTSR